MVLAKADESATSFQSMCDSCENYCHFPNNVLTKKSNVLASEKKQVPKQCTQFNLTLDTDVPHRESRLDADTAKGQLWCSPDGEIKGNFEMLQRIVAFTFAHKEHIITASIKESQKDFKKTLTSQLVCPEQYKPCRLETVSFYPQKQAVLPGEARSKPLLPPSPHPQHLSMTIFMKKRGMIATCFQASVICRNFDQMRELFQPLIIMASIHFLKQCFPLTQTRCIMCYVQRLWRI